MQSIKQLIQILNIKVNNTILYIILLELKDIDKTKTNKTQKAYKCYVLGVFFVKADICNN